MSYEDALRKLAPLLKDVWKKVDSGFYPEIDEEIKLLAIQMKIKSGQIKEGFWDLVRFLIKDLLAMSGKNLSEEKKKTADILKKLDDQKVVRQELEKLNKEVVLDPIIVSEIF